MISWQMKFLARNEGSCEMPLGVVEFKVEELK